MIQGMIKDGCFIVYDVEPVPEEPVGEEIPNVDGESLAESIKQLTEAVQKLDQDLNPEPVTDENGEEVTEEVSTEEIPEEELPVQKKDLDKVVESVDNLQKTVGEIKQIQSDQLENSTEEASTEEPQLTYLDETVDHHLYMTSEVENADINDIFTMLLSVRNVALLFMLLWLSLKIFGMIRAAVDRVMNR